MLINVKMPTIVEILTIIRMIIIDKYNFYSLKHEKFLFFNIQVLMSS